MKRDQTPSLAPLVAFGPITLSADNTPAAIDIGGAGSATLLIGVGVGGITFDGTNKVEFKLTHCDTSGGTYVAVVDDDVVLSDNADTIVGTGGIVKSLIAAHASADITKIGYVGNKRFPETARRFQRHARHRHADRRQCHQGPLGPRRPVVTTDRLCVASPAARRRRGLPSNYEHRNRHTADR